jgi:hypothetical protein
MHRMYPFRVFISHASEDTELVERVAVVLQQIGLAPIWDKGIPGGAAFDQEICRRIATAHLFMPLLTPHSAEKAWVHQEIGYALGIDIPVLPIAIGILPLAMLSRIQAISVSSDLSNLREEIEQADTEALIMPTRSQTELDRLGVTTQVAEFSEDRARTLVNFSKEMRVPARVRQRAIFSSFSLPVEPPTHQIWNSIELAQPRSERFRALLRDERCVLGQHALTAGCSLILTPFLDFASVGHQVHRTQLQLLQEFLLTLPKEAAKVAFSRGPFLGSLTLVGDSFGAKALPPQPGAEYRQTLFSHHGPTVLRWLYDFDEELHDCLRLDGIADQESRDYAVAEIEKRLRELPIG